MLEVKLAAKPCTGSILPHSVISPLMISEFSDILQNTEDPSEVSMHSSKRGVLANASSPRERPAHQHAGNRRNRSSVWPLGPLSQKRSLVSCLWSAMRMYPAGHSKGLKKWQVCWCTSTSAGKNFAEPQEVPYPLLHLFQLPPIALFSLQVFFP